MDVGRQSGYSCPKGKGKGTQVKFVCPSKVRLSWQPATGDSSWGLESRSMMHGGWVMLMCCKHIELVPCRAAAWPFALPAASITGMQVVCICEARLSASMS